MTKIYSSLKESPAQKYSSRISFVDAQVGTTMHVKIIRPQVEGTLNSLIRMVVKLHRFCGSRVRGNKETSSSAFTLEFETV